MLPIIKFTGELPERLRGRSQLSDEKVRESVKSIIAGVRERGDAALIDYTEKIRPCETGCKEPARDRKRDRRGL